MGGKFCRRGLHDLSDPANYYQKSWGSGCLPCKQAFNRRYLRKRGCSDFVVDEVARVLNGVPKTPADIRQTMLNDYGTISLRRVQAALRRLLEQNRVERVGKLRSDGRVLPGFGGYIRKQQ